LFITQTANLDAAAFDDPTLVDYFGFGHDTGNSYETGLWGPNDRTPHPYFEPQCREAPGVYMRLDDLHLTDRYTESGARSGPEATHFGSPAYPVESRLVLPACNPFGNELADNLLALEPYFDITLVPLAGWTGYNASTRTAQPIRTAVAADVRSCDTDWHPCSSHDPADGYPANNGIASEWLGELLHGDR
jgi:hypothetical protein